MANIFVLPETVMVPVKMPVKIIIPLKLSTRTLAVTSRKFRKSKYVEKYDFQFVFVKRY